MADKKNIMTYAGLKKLQDELQDLKVNQRREIAQKIKEAREQGDLSENAEYDAAKDEQRDFEARIEQIEQILKNAEVVDEEGNLLLEVSANEEDLLYDDIGSELKIRQIRKEKAELLQSLELYYKVFFLGEDVEE